MLLILSFALISKNNVTNTFYTTHSTAGCNQTDCFELHPGSVLRAAADSMFTSPLLLSYIYKNTIKMIYFQDVLDKSFRLPH